MADFFEDCSQDELRASCEEAFYAFGLAWEETLRLEKEIASLKKKLHVEWKRTSKVRYVLGAIQGAISSYKYFRPLEFFEYYSGVKQNCCELKAYLKMKKNEYREAQRERDIAWEYYNAIRFWVKQEFFY